MKQLPLALCVLLLAANPAAAQSDSPLVGDSTDDRLARHHPLRDKQGMVVSQSLIASRVGATVLARGGNAIDAAVATAFALAVSLPRAGNIGGGGFMLVYLADEDRTVAIDYREQAPLRAYRDMFLDDNGDADPDKAQFTASSSAVPGTVAGLWLAHQEFGELPWESLLVPAIDLARDGFRMSFDMVGSLAARRDRFIRSAASMKYFFREDGSNHEAGDWLVQKDLARSLELIANDGPDAFYRGPIADLIVTQMQKDGGLIDRESLAAYRAVIREPVRGSYRGHEIVSMPPPSSGGIHVIQMLNVLEHFDISAMGYGSADSIHLLAETMRLAYADRSEHLGDADFYAVPAEWLMSKQYAQELAAKIDMRQARPSDDVKPGVPPLPESPDTTHFRL